MVKGENSGGLPFLPFPPPPLRSKLGAGPGSSDWLGAGGPAPPLHGAGFLPALPQDGIKGARASRREQTESLLGVGTGGTRTEATHEPTLTPTPAAKSLHV